ncbi:NB-ARC domain-containing protein [Streptomyces sp. NPDC059679]|uniref:NB-ARC domain-containing protein n=1 Tax=Streptomyces sp. NPDC059679 TaxID=3346903 RepID=UPI0036A9E835
MPRPPATWPHQVGTIPPQAGAFQHREQAEHLREAVAEGGTAVLSQVLSGMGGVGKTQLAADYARTAWKFGAEPGGVDVLIWISASSRDAIVAGYAQAAEELCGADAGDTEQAARAFLAWLQPKPGAAPCRWLVVLDDVTDPSHVRGLWPPASPTGRTLATTRRRDAALTGRGRVVTVGLFTEAEAIAYLTDALNIYGRSEPDDQLAGLTRDLGYLPLALSQAAAYLTDTLLSCAAYRALLAKRKRRLADLIPEDSALPDDQAATVAATWALSTEHANKIRPAGLARPMLHLTVLLDPNGIPATVLTTQRALAYLTEHRPPTSTGSTHPSAQVSAEDAALALRALHRLSLIDHSPTTPHQAVRVHQLIQRATRDTLTPDQHHQLARTAADALLETWQERMTVATSLALRANTAALADNAGEALYRPNAHAVLYHIGGFSSSGIGLTDLERIAIRDHLHHLTTATTRYLGPDHLDTLTARREFAHWRGSAGDPRAAVAAMVGLLPDVMRVLGPDHPDTLTTRRELAQWRGEAGNLRGAETAMTGLLSDVMRVLGPNHPETFLIRRHLADLRGVQGDWLGAEAELSHLLDAAMRVLGPSHPYIREIRSRHKYWRTRIITDDDAFG